METNKLKILIKQYEQAVKGINYRALPARDSEEYRVFMLETANDKVFFDGSSSVLVEWLFDVFDITEVQDALKDVAMINALTDLQRLKLRFYLDLRDVCYPLLRGEAIDWTAWPWCLENTTDSMDNGKLFDFITQSKYWNISAAICLYLKNKAFDNSEFYSSVAQRDIADSYHCDVSPKWKAAKTSTEEGMTDLACGCQSFASELWSIENHINIGRMLGLDSLGQNVYDALSTYVDREYCRKSILYAREMAAWIKANWDMDDKNPSEEKQKELLTVMFNMTDKHNAKSPDIDYAWNILTMDVLGIENPYTPWTTVDNDNWSEE